MLRVERCSSGDRRRALRRATKRLIGAAADPHGGEVRVGALRCLLAGLRLGVAPALRTGEREIG